MDKIFAGLSGYFSRRSLEADLHSAFSCDPECSRPGCKSSQMQVPVTILDILAVAIAQSKPILHIFQEHYSVGLLPVGGRHSIFRVVLKLIKPCSWLHNEFCSIYKIRPLACILFPESHVLGGTLQELIQQPDSKDYVCTRFCCDISRERAKVIKKLNGQLQKELLISDSYLFGSSPFFLDLTNVEQDFLKQVTKPEKSAADLPDSDASLTLAELDAVFHEKFFSCFPFLSLEQKLFEFGDAQVHQKAFDQLGNKKAVSRLFRICDGSGHVFRLEGGILSRSRVHFAPPECNFM